jgi:hypothetical protein
MPCGCKKRMKKLEQVAPKVADLVRPAHELAMAVIDRIGAPGDGNTPVGTPEPPVAGTPSAGGTS